ncbi:hypothetical protein F5Y10DRAFT_261750 [Nemania abortiva]|nr:hypothetical protein F5Y10DRAFT_261750 [Nemania abortiva]
MLRRPPTTLSLTAEDIANYEDRRYNQLQAQLQSQAQAQAQAQAHAQTLLQPRSQATRARQQQQQPPTMDTLTSSPNDSTDEAMEDAAGGGFDSEHENDDEDEEGEDDDDEDDDPFTTHRHLARAAGAARAVSPGAQRSAYVRQMRARGRGHGRSQSHTHATSIPTSTSTYTSAAALRAQRITGSASASALPSAAASGQGAQVPAHLQQTPVQNVGQGTATMTRAAAGRGGRQASEPPPAPTRVTRSRDERIGIAPGARPVDMGPGAHGLGQDGNPQTQTPPGTEPRRPLAPVATPMAARRIQLRARIGTWRGARAQRSSRDTAMQIDGQPEDEDTTEIDEDVYPAGLRVAGTPNTPAQANVDAGSPLPSLQRRQTRSYTMRLARQPSMVTHSMHARGFSDSAGVQMAGRAGFAGTGPPQASRSDYNEHEQGGAGAEGRGVDDDGDRMQID